MVFFLVNSNVATYPKLKKHQTIAKTRLGIITK
jgi:hypothetical protein